jgi:gliding motility-associated-like protein
MKKLVPLILLFFAFNIYSQKEANFWYFGEESGLDFSTNPPNAIKGSLSTDEGSASISDSNGILQFYTDGSTVYDRTDTVMTNGTELLGDSSSAQSAIIVPKPKDPNIYYVFTVGNQQNGNQGNGVMYSEVDMSLNGGSGEITSKNIELNSSENAREKITSVRGSTCNTFWVITSDRNRFYAYLIDENGVQNSAIVSAHNNNLDNLRGYLKISPDGKTLVSANASSGTYIFDFNAATGQITNGGEINGITNGGYGVEFSRNGKKLYISTGTYSQINPGTGVRNPPEFASVTQFSLESRNITDITNSANLIYSTNTGYRGALQLASNGKIYYARSRTNFLGLINSPEKEAANINFIIDGLTLDKPSTEGLPPFIQSFFLDIDIIDSDTNNSVNNQDLQFCIGQDKIIKPAVIDGTNVNYEWTFDDGTTISEISSSPTITDLTLNDIQTTNSGSYKLKITLKDICDNDIEYNGTFNITVFKAATATKPDNINSCDEDLNGSNTFDLQNDTDLKDKILTGLDASNFEVLYFSTLSAANDNLAGTDLPNPYTLNTGSTQIIYARVQNINAPEACFALTTFTIAVTGFPVPETPTDYPFCDNISVGSDTDGFVDDFILENKDAQILGSLDPNQYTVSYHTTQNGAQTSATLEVIPKTTKYTNTTANRQPVYVRVENRDNTSCFDASKTFYLIVNVLPTVASSAELLQCDDDLDRISTINLTEAEISISTNYLNESFTYFETEAAAISGTPQVADKLRYPVNRTGTAWVRTISDKNCYRISKINLEVEAAADVNYYKDFPSICDDFLEKEGTYGPLNNDTDGITNFDFSEANGEILSFFPPPLRPDLEIAYFETNDDRTAVINEIADISNYRNIGYPSNITKQTIYFKITNKNNNNCNGSGELYLKTNPVPTANQVTDLELCDSANDGDATNGIVQNFDLESQTSNILGSQNNSGYKVTYHLSKTDANSGNDAQASPFENTIKDLQTIYVRVTNNNTGCFTDHNSFQLIVNPLPMANFVKDLEVCDDNSDGSARNGFSQIIDLESQTNGILGNQDPNIYAVTYHHSLEEAQNGTNKLLSPYSNTTPNKETIYVRVYNASTKCANGISNFQVIVNPEPTFTAISNLSYCDDSLDGDDTNGAVQNIDLDSQIPILLGAPQDPDDYEVTFHSSKANASSGDLPIESPYTNTNAVETMYVRIRHKTTSCVNDDATFEVIVNSLPKFTVTSPQTICLNDTPKNIAVENTTAIYSYVWKDTNGNEVGTADNLEITTGGNYTVTATTTNGTMCTRAETIVVKESNPATLLASYVTIIDEGNNIGSENNLSIVIDTLNNDLGPGNYQFALKNDDQNTTTFYQEEPLFENLEGGIYTIIVNDKNGCIPDATLKVSVLQFPKFFTPNGDNKNDTWIIKGANKTFYPNSSINIFNRYGKLVAQIPIDGKGWNGTYNSKKLISDDYWYTITLIPADATKQTINKTGHFSLLRK